MTRNDEAMLTFVRNLGQRLIEEEKREEERLQQLYAALTGGQPIQMAFPAIASSSSPSVLPHSQVIPLRAFGNRLTAELENDPVESGLEVIKAYARGEDIVLTVLSQER